MNLDSFEQLAHRRKTVKVLSQENLPAAEHRAIVDRLIATAGWAPFHKVCSAEHRSNNELDGIEPWRFHALDAEACRKLRTRVANLEGSGKIPAMLASADSLIITT